MIRIATNITMESVAELNILFDNSGFVNLFMFYPIELIIPISGIITESKMQISFFIALPIFILTLICCKVYCMSNWISYMIRCLTPIKQSIITFFSCYNFVIYNLLLLLLYVFLVLISYSAYKKTKRKPYLYLALLGICFVLDLSFIFIYKFTNANNIKLYNNYRSILGFFTFFNYMMIFSKTINRKLNAFSFVPFITVIVVFYINNIAPNNIVACLFLKTCSSICLLEMCIIYFAHYLIYDDLETRNKIIQEIAKTEFEGDCLEDNYNKILKNQLLETWWAR